MQIDWLIAPADSSLFSFCVFIARKMINILHLKIKIVSHFSSFYRKRMQFCTDAMKCDQSVKSGVYMNLSFMKRERK